MAMFAKLRESLKSVREKWSSGIASLFTSGKFTPDFWDDLEEQLISGDTGLDFTEEIIDYLKAETKRKGIKTPEGLKDLFTAKIAGELSSVDGMGQPFTFAKTPLVLLMAGVNGSGKTTSSGKLAAMYAKQGKKVILAAAPSVRRRLNSSKSGVNAQESGSSLRVREAILRRLRSMRGRRRRLLVLTFSSSTRQEGFTTSTISWRNCARYTGYFSARQAVRGSKPS